MKNKKSNEQFYHEFQIKKRVFLSKLKNAPYSDKLISMWTETFKDDSIFIQFLNAIKLNNEQWKEYRKGGVTISEYVQAVYNHYTVEQGIPHNLVIPIFIGSSDEIANQFIADEAIKNMKILQENGVTIFDMSN
jgi:hypothetical protein